MAQPAQAADPLLAREFSKLFTAASKVSEVRAGRAGVRGPSRGARGCRLPARAGLRCRRPCCPHTRAHVACPSVHPLASLPLPLLPCVRLGGTRAAARLRRLRIALPRTRASPALPLPAQPQVFTTREKAQLDVYGTWAVLRNQLAATDDSFAFNKARGCWPRDARVEGVVGEPPPTRTTSPSLPTRVVLLSVRRWWPR